MEKSIPDASVPNFEELYGRVKSNTDKFFETIRETKTNEVQGKTNLVSPTFYVRPNLTSMHS